MVRADAQFAWLEPVSETRCDGCPSAGQCHTSFLANILQRRQLSQLKILNLESAKTGDRVLIGIHPVSLLLGSLFAYLLPVALMIALAAFGVYLFSESISIILGLGGLAIGLLLSNRAAAHLASCGDLEPVMIRCEPVDKKIIKINQASDELRL